jgi:hypothetical protein
MHSSKPGLDGHHAHSFFTSSLTVQPDHSCSLLVAYFLFQSAREVLLIDIRLTYNAVSHFPLHQNWIPSHWTHFSGFYFLHHTSLNFFTVTHCFLTLFNAHSCLLSLRIFDVAQAGLDLVSSSDQVYCRYICIYTYMLYIIYIYVIYIYIYKIQCSFCIATI